MYEIDHIPFHYGTFHVHYFSGRANQLVGVTGQSLFVCLMQELVLCMCEKHPRSLPKEGGPVKAKELGLVVKGDIWGNSLSNWQPVRAPGGG